MAREDFDDTVPATAAIGRAAPHEPDAFDRLALSGAARPATAAQAAVGLGALVLLCGWIALEPAPAFAALHLAGFVVFTAVTLLRIGAGLIAEPPRPVPPLADADLPSYSVIAPLFHEAHMAAALVEHLGRLDYPADRLEILLALEADDPATLDAVEAAGPPPHMRIVVAPPATPRTKPRACNVALAQATGALVTVFDAEDRPEPGQLREAAARFAAGPPELACLQAPLRIAETRGLLSRQFALEYAVQFEILLPALSRMGAPFPLGGTSNHFRADVLRRIGGWDPYNVTEDADIGFRLAERGYRLGMLALPTWEPPPERLYDWLPQRSRWVKGHMQTFGVHTRRPLAGGAGCCAALQATLGVSIASALLHGPLAAWIVAEMLVWACGGGTPRTAFYDPWLFFAGWLTAGGLMALGARRTDLKMRLGDLFMALAYWPLQSLAALHAMRQLVASPYHWDKTEHRPLALRPAA